MTKTKKAAKAKRFRTKLDEAAFGSKKMLSILHALINRKSRSDALSDMDSQKLADSFSEFFHEKIAKIRQSFTDDPLPEIP